MKRLSILGVLVGALVFGMASTSQAYYPWVGPRVVPRAVVPPFGPRVVYGPRVYGPRVFYGPGYGYYGPRYVTPYRPFVGPGIYGPRVGIGIY